MRSHSFAIVMTLVALAGCATSSQPPAGRLEDVTEARVTVSAIDPAQRLVTLKDESGKQIVAEVAQSVQNLEKVKVGDQVIVSYTKMLAWQVRPAGQAASGFSAQPTATAAKPGDQIKGSVSGSVQMTATITAIDLANGTVTLKGPDGNSETIKARDPANLKKVKVGDLVDITYTEAVAVAVRPANAK